MATTMADCSLIRFDISFTASTAEVISPGDVCSTIFLRLLKLGRGEINQAKPLPIDND